MKTKKTKNAAAQNKKSQSDSAQVPNNGAKVSSNGAKTTIKNILSGGSDLKYRFIPDYMELEKIVKTFKEMGYKIVLTQGVYDLIHEGHAAYLEAAKALGDVLIVGVDSDELTRKRKGPERPIVPQEERLKMLVHLRHVDIVTIRESKDGIGDLDLVKLVSPDFLVTSESTKDFTRQMAQKYGPSCGKIVTLPPQATTTTSARIRNLTIEGAEKLAREVSVLTQDFLDKIRQKK
ncbi:MAG: adenylyltransferase/cytidyltransferase family protein [Candidatus Pacebacteria bacterium]|nr:adenylyltransferase/cytidyltransferase family protein [Candidatus Paceibacterota bacterium]